ncbi:MAG: aldose 1-epimerase family protein [Bacilli bacterium]|nr:aldose 1-epimerase family protein [Bacilli bacterium]
MNITIRNAQLTLLISTIGAEKISLKTASGKEYLHQPDEFWSSTSPFLFPIVGRLKNGFMNLNGKEYHLPLHGFLRHQEFEVLQQKEDEVTLVNVHNKETLEIFPYQYKVFITHQLKDLSVKTSVRITNHSNEVMPFNFGGHPGFTLPLYPNETFEDYRIVFQKPEKFSSPVVEQDGTINYNEPWLCFNELKELPLEYRYFENDAIIIPRVRSEEVLLINQNHQGIRFQYPGFVTLAIWTRPNAPFVCLEPWIGHGDRHDTNHDFLTKDNIVYLDPTADFNIQYTITILE